MLISILSLLLLTIAVGSITAVIVTIYLLIIYNKYISEIDNLQAELIKEFLNKE